METKQTAVDYLYRIVQMGHYISKSDWDKAKEIEKEQIAKAWDDGDYAYFHSKETGRDFENGKEYYNETYKK